MPAVRFEHVSKRFPGVHALERRLARDRRGLVPRALRRERRGQEHARQDPRRHSRARRRTTVRARDARCTSTGPRDALAAGVGMVHQELAFCDNLSVAENLCLGATARSARLRRSRRRWSGARRRCSPRSAHDLDVEPPIRRAVDRRSSRWCRSPPPSAAARASSSSTSRRAA